MTYSDWTHYETSGTTSLDENNPYEGNASLKVDAGAQDYGTITGAILTQSLADSPTEGQIVTYSKVGSPSPDPCFYFRVQDANNFYMLYLPHYGIADLYQVVNGNETRIQNYINTSFPDNVWTKFRVSQWVDVSDDVRTRIEYSTDDGTNWTTEAEWTHTTPVFTNGGGIGIGANNGTVNFDQSEIYY